MSEFFCVQYQIVELSLIILHLFAILYLLINYRPDNGKFLLLAISNDEIVADKWSGYYEAKFLLFIDTVIE